MVMKIFSNHRRKLEPYRRFGSREFKEKLTMAKGYKRTLEKGFISNFFGKTGFSTIGLLVGVGGLGAIFYFLVLSPYFLVNQITVSGNTQVTNDQVLSVFSSLADERFVLVPKNSFFYLSQSRVEKLFAQQLPMVKELKSTRSWPNKISIEVTERTPAIVLSASGRNYLVDELGFVINEVETESSGLKVEDLVLEEILPGSVIDGKLIPFIISAQKQWGSKMTVPISLAKIPGIGASEVEFVSQEGWSVFFSTERPVANQLSNLQILLSNQINASNRTRLAYIDLRLAKWAYYCFKATPCQQSEQQENIPSTAGSEIKTEETDDIRN
jgi:cell division septal protein FtsQ